MRWNLDALSISIVTKAYNFRLDNKFAALKILDEDRPLNELFKVFKEVVLTTAREMLGKAPKKIRKPWVSDNTLRLIDRRRVLKSLGNSSEEGEERYREV